VDIVFKFFICSGKELNLVRPFGETLNLSRLVAKVSMKKSGICLVGSCG
jgi:hypothetical protein